VRGDKELIERLGRNDLYPCGSEPEPIDMSTQDSSSRPRQVRAEPQSFRASALSVSLTVTDLERSVRWYTDAIGFIVTQRHERAGRLVAVTLKAGTATILLGQDDGAKGWELMKRDGITLQFTTAQNVDALAARISANGWPLLSEPTDAAWGPRSLRVADPDGYRLVFSP
jgi:uncharacterized glyoxalase superfamily protein PhnB